MKKNLEKVEVKWKWFLLAIALLLTIVLLPTPLGLTTPGQVSLAILAFSIVIWMTEAVSYPVSAVLILAFLTLMLGLGPSLDNPDVAMGTKDSLALALSGFSSAAVALVAGALILAVAMQITGLDRRIALMILSKVGSGPKGIFIGTIVVGIALSFFIPSPTARVGAIIPIILGMISAFGLQKESRFATVLIISSAHIATIWSVGIKTGSAQNMVGLDFIEKEFNKGITWLQWFLAAAPWALLMTIFLYFVIKVTLPIEKKSIKDGKKMVKKQLQQLGSVTGKELRLLIISCLLVFCWATEGYLHPFDSTSIIIIGLALMILPGLGVLKWKEAEKLIPWDTVILFATGISLGTILLKTNAATWIANTLFQKLGITSMPPLMLIGILSLFLILIHLGFASATSLSSTVIPVVIAVVQGMNEPNINQIGIILITQFAIGFGFILPVNAPQNMLAYGIGTLTQKDFLKTGIPLTILGYLLILLFSVTYWKWIGFI